MKQLSKIIIIFLAVGIIGYFAYNFIMQWHEEELEVARMQAREEMKLRKRPPVPKDKLREALGEVPEEVPGEEKRIGFEEIDAQVKAFFDYLDSRDYVSAYNLEGGTYNEFQRIVKELSANPPVIVGETESLHTLLRNMSHFFRVMGMERINLVKDILENESEIIESVMKTFYLWVTRKNDPRTEIKGHPSFEVLYKYSSYFLNTIAGKSYLLRREPKVRILTTYYCVLILDKSNDLLINSFGIDIRPYLQLVFNDIKNQTILINEEEYLSELERLEDKYQL